MMVRLALGTLRRHRGTNAGTFLAAFLAVGLLSGAGLLLFSVLAAKPPADRFSAAAVVVSGAREVTVRSVEEKKKGKVKTKTKHERLTGAGTLPADLAGRIAGVAGVAEAIADYAFPVVFPVRGADDAPVIGHGWASAGLTPYTLRSGRSPAAGEVVIDADLAARGGLSVGDQVQITTRTGPWALRVSGVATLGMVAGALPIRLMLRRRSLPAVTDDQ